MCKTRPVSLNPSARRLDVGAPIGQSWAVWVVLLLAVAPFTHANPRVAYREMGEGFRVGVKIRVLDLANGSVTQFVDDWLHEGASSWGPQGDSLVASAERDTGSDIFRARVGSAHRTWLTEHPGSDGNPAWSPEGRRVAFASYRDGGWQIYVMDIDGTNLRRVTEDPLSSTDPSWSPDGNSLVYRYFDNLGLSVVRSLDLGTGVTRSLTPDDEFVTAPALSWDGQYVAFGTHEENSREWHVEVMTLDRRDRWRVTENAGRLNSGPAWTPDGDVSFLSSANGANNIAVTGLQGGDVEILTDSRTYKEHLAWYNPRWFPVQALAALQPKLWGRLKR